MRPRQTLSSPKIEIQKGYARRLPNNENLSHELIQTLGMLQTSIRSNNWFATPIEIQVVADGHRSLLGRDLFPALGLSIQQSNNPRTINQAEDEICPIKKQIATDFPDLISRISKSKLQTVPSKFHKKYTSKHQKGRQVLEIF